MKRDNKVINTKIETFRIYRIESPILYLNQPQILNIILVMSNNSPYLQRRQRKEESSFFACLQCQPDEGEIDSLSQSSVYSRKNFQKISMNPSRASNHTIQKMYMTDRDLRESRKSDKISIKGRRSTLQSHSIRTFDPELPPFLPQQPNKPSVNQQIHYIRPSIDSNFNMSVRSSGPQVSFSYREPPPNVKQPVLQERSRPLGLQIKNLSPQPQNQLSRSPSKNTSPLKSKASSRSPFKQLNPKIVVSKNIDGNSQPLSESQFVNYLPRSQLGCVNLQHTDKKLSDLYKQINGDVYDLVPSPKLIPKNISKTHKGFGGSNAFKCRQTVSIREPEQQEDYVHESIVIERTNHNGMLNGLLHPINESDEYPCGMGTTLFSQMRQR